MPSESKDLHARRWAKIFLLPFLILRNLRNRYFGGDHREQGKRPPQKGQDIELYLRRLKESYIKDKPEKGQMKKKRPSHVAIMDPYKCFPCGKCPEFCPVECIEYYAEGTIPQRGQQPVQDRFQECIGCWICVEVCTLLTDYDAIRMYPTGLVEEVTGISVGDKKPEEYHPAHEWVEHVEKFIEGEKYCDLGEGSKILPQKIALPWKHMIAQNKKSS